jgi:hypothetical protein
MASLRQTISFVIVVATLSLITFPVMAKLNQIDAGTANNLGIASGGAVALNARIVAILRWLLSFLGLIGVVAVIYGGVQ